MLDFSLCLYTPPNIPCCFNPKPQVLQHLSERLHHQPDMLNTQELSVEFFYLTIISYLLIDYLPLLGLPLLAVADLKVFVFGNPGKFLSTRSP